MANDFNMTDLAQADPSAPGPQDAAAAKAGQDAQQASMVADALSGRNLQPKFDSAPVKQPVNATQAEPGALSDLRNPGSFAWHLANSVSSTLSNPALADKVASDPQGFAKMMFFGGLHGIAQSENGPAQPAEGTVPKTGAWAAAASNADATQPTRIPAAPRPSFGAPVMALAGDMAGPGRGFAGYAAANTKRTAEEEKDRAQIAASNAQMLHEQALTHKLGEDQIAVAAASGKEGLNAIMNAEVPGTKKAEGLTSDEIGSQIRSGAIDPSKDTVFLTGRIMTGKDANGQPLYRSTYSVVEPHGEVELSEKQADYINEHLGMKLIGKSDDQVGQKLPAAQFNSLWQNAQGHEANDAARDLALAQIGEKKDKAKLDHETAIIGQDPLVLGALTAASKPGPNGEADPHVLVKAYNALVNNAPFMKDHPNFTQSYPKWAGGGNATKFETMQENYSKAQEKNANTTLQMLDDFEKKPEMIEGKTPAYTAAFQSILNDPKNKDNKELLARASSALAITKSTEAHELQFKASEAGAKKKAEDTAGLGDVDELIESAKNYNLDPEKMFGVRGGQRAAFMNKFLKETGMAWNEGDYKARYQTKQDFRPEGKAGLQIQSLNTFAEHARAAEARIPAINNSSSPLWNTAMNKIAVQVGSEEYGRMVAALEAVKDEYLTFLKNGHASNVDEEARANSILNANASPKAIHGVIAQMAETVAARGGQLQRNYTHQIGKAYPEMLDPENDVTLKKWGINTDKMNGIPSAPQGAVGHKVVNGITIYQVGTGANAKIVNAAGQPVDPNTGKPTGAQ